MTSAQLLASSASSRSHARCPKCYVTFFVSTAQLKQGNGFVRCSHCNKLFYAQDHLQAPARITTANPEKTIKAVVEINPRPQNIVSGHYQGLCPPTKIKVPSE